MKFKGIFRGIDFNLTTYLRVLDEYMQDKLEEGAREWLTAVTGRVPLWSGMARASLLQISQLVNGRVILSPLKGKSRIPRGQILGEGSIEITPPIYKFIVATSVPHYVVQEERNVGRSPTAPWRSFDAGKAAFELFARSIDLPSIDFSSKVIKRL